MWSVRQRTAGVIGETRAGSPVGKNSGLSYGQIASLAAEPQGMADPHSPKQMLCRGQAI